MSIQLKPDEILRYLGFDIPPEGITISHTDDVYLVTRTLELAGATINVAAIPEVDLAAMHVGLAGVARRQAAADHPDAASLEKLRETLRAVLTTVVRRRHRP